MTSSVPRGLPITPPHWWLHYPTPTHPAVALGGEQDPFLQGSGLACVQAQSVAESGGARVTPLAVCCLLLLSQQGPEELEGGASSKPDSSSFLQACPQPLPPFCRPLSPPCVSSALCAPGPRASIWGGGATAPTGPPASSALSPRATANQAQVCTQLTGGPGQARWAMGRPGYTALGPLGQVAPSVRAQLPGTAAGRVFAR